MTNTIYIDEDSTEGSETASPAREQTTNRLETISRMKFWKKNRRNTAGSRINKMEGTTHNKASTSKMEGTTHNKASTSLPPGGSRYNLGKRATIPTKDFMSFASREHLQDQVMEALQNEGTYLIGVYGMGGVGKTTFVSQVYKKMKEDGNLFDDVVMVKNITIDVDLKRIQNEIADGLGFEDIKKVDNEITRAEMLFERLEKKRTLVILDDLWSSLNFDDVGIPCGGSCNVIITTRRLEVCTSYDSIVPIKIDGLSEVDSWHLFKKMNVNDLAYPPHLEKTAKEIANECGGLPLALVTLAKGLRKKEMDVWKNTLHELQNSKIPDIEEIDSKVYTSIKLSYVHLKNPIFKKCFLLCSLFPRAHDIYIPDLMAYLIADDDMMSEDEWTLEKMKAKVSTILAKLVDSSLLLRKESSDGPHLSSVSMHDVIRDVAINIASEEGNGFLVKAGLGLKHWPTKSLASITNGNGKYWRRLSLMINEISNLPVDPPELPHLSSLSLCANESLKEIPNCFFERMGSLETLNLRDTGISSLPSLSFLLNLKTLYLDRCKFNRPTNICVIGMLKKLEILSLANCRLMGLPEELRGLTNLRLLNVEGNYGSPNFTIPRNVLRSLSRLEYLNTYDCNIKWEVEGWGNGSNASLEEVASLNYLSGLELKLNEDDVSLSGGDIHINDDADISTENPKCGHVNKFSIFFSDATGILLMSSYPMVNPLPSNCKVDVSPPVCPSIKVLIQRVEILSVKGSLKSLGQLGDRFNNLKELRVFCKEMEYLMSVEETGTERLFVALEKLFLDSLYRLKAIFLGWVDRLRDLDIRHCGEIVSIFDPNLGIRSAPNLESLFVVNCGGLKDVFNLKIHQRTSSTSLNIDQEGLSDVTFSRLRRMELFGLPILENIWNGCIPFRCFENLEELKVSDCEKLKYLFSPSMARNLQNLKILVIIKCNMVKLILMDSKECKIILLQVHSVTGVNNGKYRSIPRGQDANLIQIKPKIN